MTKTEDLLNDAIKTIQSRGLVYGHPMYNMERISKLVSSYLEYPIMPHDVCIINILQKISRLQETPGHYDSLVDIAAYAAIYRIVFEAETDINFKKGDDL
jgi:hypothetical protein